METKKEKKSKELSKYLLNNEHFWQKIPQSTLLDLKTGVFSKAYGKGELIYGEGAHPKGLYRVVSGAMKVYILDSNGAEQIIYFMGEGDIVGYRLIAGDAPSPVYITTLCPCVVEVMPRQDIERHLRSNTYLSAAFMEIMGEEFRVFVNKIAFFTQKSASERVALSLLLLNATFNGDAFSNKAIYVPRKDLANYAGVATENLIRHLKRLKEEGIIHIQGKRLFIVLPDQLFEIANMIE